MLHDSHFEDDGDADLPRSIESPSCSGHDRISEHHYDDRVDGDATVLPDKPAVSEQHATTTSSHLGFVLPIYLFLFHIHQMPRLPIRGHIRGPGFPTPPCDGTGNCREPDDQFL